MWAPEPQSLLASPLFEKLTKNPLAAARHGLSGYVADLLHAVGKPTEPFLADARSTVVRATQQRRLLGQVLDALAKVNVTPIALKGFGLAERLYANPMVRPSTDVDVLVTPAELEQAGAALATLGLRQVELDAGFEDVFEEHHHLAYAGPAGLVEVHFRLFSGHGSEFDDAAIRAGARVSRIDGREVQLLRREDELVYLCAHAAGHSFMRLSWLVDVLHFLHTEPVSWPVAAEVARAARFSVAVAAALRLVERGLGGVLPAGASDAFGLSRRRALAVDQLFSAERLVSASLSEKKLSAFAIRLLFMEKPRDAGRALRDGARRIIRRARHG